MLSATRFHTSPSKMSTARAIFAFLLVCAAFQGVAAGRDLRALVIRQGINPWARNTIVCRNNVLHFRGPNNVFLPAVFWNGNFYPTSAILAANLLARDAFSCVHIQPAAPRVTVTQVKIGGR